MESAKLGEQHPHRSNSSQMFPPHRSISSFLPIAVAPPSQATLLKSALSLSPRLLASFRSSGPHNVVPPQRCFVVALSLSPNLHAKTPASQVELKSQRTPLETPSIKVARISSFLCRH
ncbi:hypothetical protein AAC387_Pa07g2186 [Persea americana]